MSYSYSHFPDEENEAQKGYALSSRLHSQEGVSWDMNPGHQTRQAREDLSEEGTFEMEDGQELACGGQGEQCSRYMNS